MSLTKLLKNNLSFHILIALIFFGCNKQPETKKYVARVNDAYLTEEDVADLDSLFEHGISKNELIKKWIEKELLFQEAVKTGITDGEEFNKIVNSSRRELASSMLLAKHLENKLKQPNSIELRDFFDKHENEFRTAERVFVFNSASFSDENTAIRFRTKLIEANWEDVIEDYSDNKSLITFQSNGTHSMTEIYPVKILNLIEALNPGEVSIVFEENPEKYTVIQLIQDFDKGTIPPLEVVKDEVAARYISEKGEEISNEYLEELQSKSEIEIKVK
jgi:hypothetical protein